MAVRRFLIFFFLVMATFPLTGCFQPARGPIGTIYFTSPEAGQNRCLFIFLPGRWDHPQSFEEEGFTAAVRQTKLPIDMMAADAHMGYYLKKNFPERLKEDVITPAKKKGYEQIWLIGISMGGLGALWYDGKYPGELTGIVALAPYLGEPEISREVSLAGGLAAWNPPTIAEDDVQRQIWRGLKIYMSRGKFSARVYMGYGLQDRFAVPNGVFAEVLPREQVFTSDGGHDWATWRRLWTKILNESILQQIRNHH